jgi:hypothetical protein
VTTPANAVPVNSPWRTDLPSGEPPPILRIMHEHRVSTWHELVERLFADSWNPGLRRYRSPFAFRGSPYAEHRLETTLIRLGGEYRALERHLLRNFRKYAHRDVVERDSVWHWLSVAQHHGLPTRLLDWTYSPFVALHFATADIDRRTDSVIWMVDFRRSHDLLPDRLRERLEREQSHVFTVEMLSQAIASLEGLDAVSPDPVVIFFEPPSIDDRIVNQFALFSVMSSATARLGDWLEEHPELSRKLVIPAELKWEVRDKLDQANVTERVLFPGLDGLSRWLKRQYMPGP